MSYHILLLINKIFPIFISTFLAKNKFEFFIESKSSIVNNFGDPCVLGSTSTKLICLRLLFCSIILSPAVSKAKVLKIFHYLSVNL